MASSPQNLPRAAIFGLALGLIGAAGIFVFNAWQNATRDCTFPDTEECAQELATGVEIARLQGFTSIGCALMGGGLLLFLRRR